MQIASFNRNLQLYSAESTITWTLCLQLTVEVGLGVVNVDRPTEVRQGTRASDVRPGRAHAMVRAWIHLRRIRAR